MTSGNQAPSDTVSVLTYRTGIQDANAAGNVHGGGIIRVEAENVETGTVRHTCTAYLTMISFDAEDRPAGVPQLRARSPIEDRRMAEAQARRELRLSDRPKSDEGGT